MADYSNINYKNIPIDKQDIYKNKPKNSGIVKVQCLINSYCPFVKYPYVNKLFMFNERTFRKFILTYGGDSDSISKILTITPNNDGLHFRPRTVYRNNYLKNPTGGRLAQTIEVRDRSESSVPYVDKQNKSDSIESSLEEFNYANKAFYKKEQSWRMIDGLYSLNTSEVLSFAFCLGIPEWEYHIKNVPDNTTAADKKNDFPSSLYEVDDNDLSFLGIELFSFPDFVKSKVDFTKVLYPVQTRTSFYDPSTQDYEPIHWGVEKETPLFRGEDFFVEFLFMHDDLNTKEDSGKNEFYTFTKEGYSSIDAGLVYPDWKNVDGSDYKLPENFGVVDAKKSKSTNDGGDGKVSVLDSLYLFKKPYILIEIGRDKTYEDDGISQHYYLLIALNNEVILLHEIDGVSYQYSGSGVMSNSILSSKKTKIYFRNHLGKLVLYFYIDDSSPLVWNVVTFALKVKEKKDREGSEEVVSHRVTHSEPLFSYVDESKVRIFGGNIAAGFSFGPLQYWGGFTSFNFPPSSLAEQNKSVYNLDVTNPLGPAQLLRRPLGSDYNLYLSDDLDKLYDIFSYYQEGEYENANIDNRKAYYAQDSGFYIEQDKVRRGNFLTFKVDNSPSPLKALSADRNGAIRQSYIKIGEGDVSRDINLETAFNINIELRAGDHLFGVKSEDISTNLGLQFADGILSGGEIDSYFKGNSDDPEGDGWILTDCKTPILSLFHYEVEESKEDAWVPNEIDVSDRIMTFSSSWDMPDFSSINHSGDISFLLNPTDDDDEIANYLESLVNKAFYVNISVGYQEYSEGNVGNTNSPYNNYTLLEDNVFYPAFTGVCFGGKVEQTYGKRILQCSIKDYKTVLENQFFINSPFFDGMKDAFAIKKIMDLAGFKSAKRESSGYFSPSYILSYIMDNYNDRIQKGLLGRDFLYLAYALPFSYQLQQQPIFRFASGTSFFDAIQQITKKAGKMFFFDEIGVARYQSYYDIIYEKNEGLQNIAPLFYFTSQPTHVEQLKTGDRSQENYESYPGQLIFNKRVQGYDVESVVNTLRFETSDAIHRTPIVAEERSHKGFTETDINKEGFIGHKKEMHLYDGIFGNYESAKQMLDTYRAFFKPLKTCDFETQGLPMIAGDWISVDGEEYYVSKVNHSVDATQNYWKMDVTAERLQPKEKKSEE